MRLVHRRVTQSRHDCAPPRGDERSKMVILTKIGGATSGEGGNKNIQHNCRMFGLASS
jgi:hypothetical protein